MKKFGYKVNLILRSTILFLCLSFILGGMSFASILAIDPEIGTVMTDVGKDLEYLNAWQFEEDEEIRGFISTTNNALAYANVKKGEIKLSVSRDSSDYDRFKDVWGDTWPSIAKGAFYEKFTFSENDFNIEDINVNVSYNGTFDVSENSSAGFLINIWGEFPGDENSQTLSVGPTSSNSGVFSVPLEVANRNEDGSFNIGVSAFLQAAGNYAVADFSNSFTLSFSSIVPIPDLEVRGAGGFNQTVGTLTPIPSTFLLLGGGLVWVLRMRRKS